MKIGKKGYDVESIIYSTSAALVLLTSLVLLVVLPLVPITILVIFAVTWAISSEEGHAKDHPLAFSVYNAIGHYYVTGAKFWQATALLVIYCLALGLSQSAALLKKCVSKVSWYGE